MGWLQHAVAASTFGQVENLPPRGTGDTDKLKTCRHGGKAHIVPNRTAHVPIFVLSDQFAFRPKSKAIVAVDVVKGSRGRAIRRAAADRAGSGQINGKASLRSPWLSHESVRNTLGMDVHPSGSSMSCWSLAACSGMSRGSQEASIRPRESMSRTCVRSLSRFEFSFIRTSASSVTIE